LSLLYIGGLLRVKREYIRTLSYNLILIYRSRDSTVRYLTESGSFRNRYKRLAAPIPRTRYISDTTNSKSYVYYAKYYKIYKLVPKGVDSNRFKLLALLARSRSYR
ncbi:hypothetical protein N7534_004768, partial [Penicillium rubens]